MKLPVVPLLLVVMGVQIIGVVASIVLQPSEWTAPEPELPAPDSLQAWELGREGLGNEIYVAQVERPLFSLSRRPVIERAVTPEPVGSKANVLEDVQLLGVYGTSGEEGGVILRYEGELKRIAVGKRLDALTLARIDGMNAVFWDGKKEHVLRLAPIPRAAPVQRPQSRLLPGAAPRTPHEQTQTEAQQPTRADETVQADLPAPEGAAQLPIPAIRR